MFICLSLFYRSVCLSVRPSVCLSVYDNESHEIHHYYPHQPMGFPQPCPSSRLNVAQDVAREQKTIDAYEACRVEFFNAFLKEAIFGWRKLSYLGGTHPNLEMSDFSKALRIRKKEKNADFFLHSFCQVLSMERTVFPCEPSLSTQCSVPLLQVDSSTHPTVCIYIYVYVYV